MGHFEHRDEPPKDRATRALARTLFRRGHMIGQSELHDPSRPYCDAPVAVNKRIRSGGIYKALEVSSFRPCRRCVKCLQFRQMEWRQRALNEIALSKRTWLVTLTFAPAHLAGIMAEAQSVTGPTKVHRVDKAAYGHVQRYFKRLRRYAPQSGFRFLAVFEQGEKTGRAHYHLLLHEVGDRPLTKRFIDAQWRSHVHARLVDGGTGVATYVTKYTTKSLSTRIRASQRYGRAE